MQDAEALWRITCVEDVRRFSFEQGAVDLAFFVQWLEDYCGRSDAWMLVGLRDDAPAGYLRFERERERGRAEIDIAVGSEHRRRGVARFLLQEGMNALPARWPDVETVIAVIHAENEPSRRLFAGLGFERRGKGLRNGSPVERFERRLA